MTYPKAVSSATSRPVIDEPSFADALATIATAIELSDEKKRFWSTSLRQMARYLDRPVETIPARIGAIAPAVSKLHPERLDVNTKTFANHRANTRSALLWFNRLTRGSGRGAAMAPSFRALLDQVGDPHHRDVLSPFFRHLTGLAVEPAEVEDRHVDAFVEYRRQTRFKKTSLGYHRALVRCWNRGADQIVPWPRTCLAEPPLAQRFVGPSWMDFPESLRADIDAVCAGLARRRKNYAGQRLQPCKPSTIAMRRRELIAAVRAAVTAGIALDDLQSLRDLLHPDRVEKIIDHYWRKNGDIPHLYTIDLASKLLALARSDGSFDAEAIDRLEDIRMALEEHRPTGLTNKNRILVRQVIQGEIWPKVVALSHRLIAEANADARRNPIKAAITAELAVATRLLLVAPVRMKNLASIRLGQNLVRPGGLNADYMLVFPDYDVKNRVPLEFPLDRSTTSMIDTYLHIHRPQLLRGRDHDCLFPGSVRDQKTSQDLAEQISRRLWKVLGLKITPHQFRHAAAAIILRHEPGNYEFVRRVLGHRNIQTTINFYVGLETLEATRRFGEMVTATLIPSLPLNPRKPKRSGRAHD